MLKTTKRYVLTTNAVNAYGFRVLTDGIDWTLYNNNPIMLYMHYRPTGQNEKEVKALGNVREIEIDENGVVTGRLYFNDKYPFAVEIFEGYENGTYNMISIGVAPIEMSEDPALMLPGQIYPTISKSIAKENSCVDIGANPEAVGVALYDASGKMITLSDKTSLQTFFTPTNKNSDMKITTLSAPAILVLLKLNQDTATEAEAISKIQEIVTLADKQAADLITLADDKKKAEDALAELQKTATAEKITALVDGAVTARKITAEQKPHFITLAEGNFAGTKAVLDSMAGTPTIEQQLQTVTGDDAEFRKLCDKSYDELFRSGHLPEIKLKSKTDYARIYKAKFGNEPKD